MKQFIKVVWERYSILLGLIVLFIVSSVISEDFLKPVNLFNVMRRVSINGILAVGMTYVILTAGIDLSVGALLAAVACFAAGLIKFHGLATFPAVLMGLAIGAAFGLVNGVVITKGNIQPFIVTLAMMTAARGVAFLYSGGRPIVLGEETSPSLIFLAWGSILGIPTPATIFFVVVIVSALVLRRTPFGRYVYGIGGNEEAVRLSGVNVMLQKIIVYAVSGLLAGLAGVLSIAYQRLANANFGLGYELSAIAAVVIGGTSLAGGVGGVGGTLVGAFIMGILDNILNLRGVGAYTQDILRGIIVVLAVLMARRR